MSSNQRLVFSIMEFFNSECESRSEDERESLEVVIDCLERVYNVSLTNPSDVSKFHNEKPLTEIFEMATEQNTEEFPTDEDKVGAEELKTQGNNLMKEGKYKDAIDCYNRAMKLDWTNAVYLCNRAAAFSKLGQHEVAVKDCKEALEIDPKYGKAYGRMGTAYMALERFEEARNSFAKAKELDPCNGLYASNLKTAEQKLGQASGQSPSGGAQGLGGQPANLMSSLFSNPAVMNMATQFMANPGMQQMMTNMMSGLGGMSGNAQPPAEGQQDTANQAAGGQPDSTGTTTTESNTGTEETPATGGYSNIFQFATQMAQQLEQNNPELINNLRQTMQNVGNTGPDDSPEDPSQDGKE